MFTGIINGQGKILSALKNGHETRFSIQALFNLDNIEIGESIAVNGVCLTVESGENHCFSAYASAETLKHSNLGALTTASLVNLERALALGQRFGGHIVSGHVDGLARVESISQAGQSRCIRLGFDEKYAPEIISKGSVTLDGISLTVNACGANFLEVNVIPETWSVTTIKAWTKGSLVNMETDIIGKYVRHMLKPWNVGSDAGQNASSKSNVTEKLLAENGFI